MSSGATTDDPAADVVDAASATDAAWDARPAGFAANPVGWGRAVGQTAAVATMRSSLREDAVPHAWLLVGEDGIGQDALVVALTAALECERTGVVAAERQGATGVLADEGCGECTICRRVARGTWSGQPTFEPEGTTHLVRAVRDEWTPAALRTSAEGRRRVLRVRAADRMNEQAQNAFLKMLEEPPPAVVWWLEVADETQLLDTIHSRVRRVDLQPWRPEDLVAWATATPDVDLDRDRAARLARVAGGSPVRLAALATDVRAEARATALDVLRRLVEDGPHVVDELAREVVSQGRAAEKHRRRQQADELASLPERYGVEKASELPTGVATAMKDRHRREGRAIRGEVLLTFLDDLGSWLRDLVVLVGRGHATDPSLAVDPAGLVNRDRPDELARDAGRFTLPDLFESLAAIDRTRLSLTEHNGNPELQLSRLLLTLVGPAWEASRA